MALAMLRFKLFALVAVSACGPSIEYMPLTNVRPARRMSPEAVAVLIAPPACPYAQLGMVETTPIWPKSHNEQLWQMRQMAGEHGADAILIIDHRETEHHGAARSFTAVAIAVGPCARGEAAPPLQ